MAQVYTDSDRMRQFADKLSDFAGATSEELSQLRRFLSELGETWRDQEFDAFVVEFERAEQQLKKFVAETEKTLPQLKRDADAIDAYAQHRMS